MPYLFTSESVSEGHRPDKVADQIGDALIDNFLAFDPTSKVACETLVTTGQVVLAGEVKSQSLLGCAGDRPRGDPQDRLHEERVHVRGEQLRDLQRDTRAEPGHQSRR